jgi:predicted lipoprotein with Yx(FWY)xxD motif
MRNKWLAVAGLFIAALIVAACGSSKTGTGAASTSSASTPAAPASSSAAASAALKTTTIHGTKVLTNAKGFTLYWFGPDTSTTSKCSGACATAWPPVPGPTKAGSGVTGKLGTITRSNGAKQATYNGHPLYTFTGDKAPGQGNGTGVNAFGGVFHEVTVSGAAAPAPGKSASSGGGY